MNDIPKIKKKISSFLTKEEGKISKNKLMKTGLLIGLFSIISLKNVSAATIYTNTYVPVDCSSVVAPGGNGINPGITAHANNMSPNHAHCLETHSSHANHSNHSVGGPCDW